MRTPSSSPVNSSSLIAVKAVISPSVPDKRFKRYHRKQKKEAPLKQDRVKVKLPDGLYFRKDQLSKGHVLEFMPFKKYFKKKDIKLQEKKKKLRGARKKEAARLYKLKYPLGEPRASRPAPPYRGDIDTSVLQRFHNLSPRSARRRLNTVKKHLGKQRDHVLTVNEYCKHKNIPLEDIIPYL
ncbi:hypothetical protein [Longitalea luteola]|uniref:hypothetical protein n=1 Tax=Longitalea luteola TaxID=2812563 RepID=UPI001A972CF0|nr:hypothetical protein [Longitalea luteola]